MPAARIWLDFLIRLPGTILHELAHYLAAKLTGSRVISFSLWPSVQNDTIQYGSVTAAYRYKALMIPVAIAPLIWWVVLGWGLIALGIVLPIAGESRVAFDHRPLMQIETWLWAYPAWQLLWAGKLSRQDVRVFFGGIFSWSGIFVLATVASATFLLSTDWLPGGYIDGAGYKANNMQSFQMKYACMDLTEFREYIQQYVGEINDQAFFDSLEDFKIGNEQ